jgi:hypothetical protein
MSRVSFLVFSFLFCSTVSFGQINFVKAYLIDNDDNRIDCLIKDTDWERNPREFEYKLTENDDIKIGNLNSVKEFLIGMSSKFIRVETDIDRSITELAKLENGRNPIWSREIVFLKVILEGKASLYVYREMNFTKFFYSVSGSEIKQLVFKEYRVERGVINTNTDFQQQLFSEVHCGQISVSDMETLRYNQKDLERYFRRYNECEGSPVVEFGKSEKRDVFNLRLNSGLNYSSLAISRIVGSSTFQSDYKGELNFRIACEVEYILPVNRNKWGVTFEPAYQYFRGKNPIGNYSKSLQYKSLDFSFGLRYYFFLNEKTKVFANVIVNSVASLDFDSYYEKEYATIYLHNSPNLAFGAGFEYQGLSVELRYYAPQEILDHYKTWFSEYQKTSFIIAYKILKKSSK